MTSTKKPAVISDGRLLRLAGSSRRPDWTQRLLKLGSGNDLGGNAADAGAGQADGAGGAGRQVEHAAADEGATVVDGDDDATAAMGHPQSGAERQTAVSRGHGVLVEPLARSSLAAGFIAVKRSHAGEAVTAADRRVGVTPGRRSGMAGVGTMMVPGGFGG